MAHSQSRSHTNSSRRDQDASRCHTREVQASLEDVAAVDTVEAQLNALSFSQTLLLLDRLGGDPRASASRSGRGRSNMRDSRVDCQSRDSISTTGSSLSNTGGPSVVMQSTPSRRRASSSAPPPGETQTANDQYYVHRTNEDEPLSPAFDYHIPQPNERGPIFVVTKGLDIGVFVGWSMVHSLTNEVSGNCQYGVSSVRQGIEEMNAAYRRGDVMRLHRVPPTGSGSNTGVSN